MPDIKTIDMQDGIPVHVPWWFRQYNVSGTGEVTFYGIALGSTVYEDLGSITVAGEAIGQISMDLYPTVKGVVTAGNPTFNVTGCDMW